MLKLGHNGNELIIWLRNFSRCSGLFRNDLGTIVFLIGTSSIQTANNYDFVKSIDFEKVPIGRSLVFIIVYLPNGNVSI